MPNRKDCPLSEVCPEDLCETGECIADPLVAESLEDRVGILTQVSTLAGLPWVKCKCGKYFLEGLEEVHKYGNCKDSK